MNYSPMQDTTHTCFGGCGSAVSRHLFACRRCWRRLPMRYQTQILTSHWAGDWEAHSRAMTDAIRWYHDEAEARRADAIRDLQ